MISFEQAKQKVLASARTLETERVDLADSLGRVLAEDVTSDMDMPPFNKSAMDGYACKRADLDSQLTVIETLPAGIAPQKTVTPGKCAKIMTGAVVPDGADCVIMKEYVEQLDNNHIVFTGKSTKDNICIKGEDIKTGDIALARSAIIAPQHIAVLASVGCPQPLVSKKPTVGIIATGSELVAPGSKPSPSQIRNSNSYQLTAQVEKAGATPTNYGIAEDTEEAIDSVIKKAIRENDVLLISGGVSVGDFDLVRGILKNNNVDLLFEKIAVKPGRPTVFGIADNCSIFGLPGNPVSTFVLFEILVKPFLHKMMGRDQQENLVTACLHETISRKRSDRDSYLPVRFTETGTIKNIEYHGSAHINSMCGAQGLICMPKGTAELQEGEVIAVRPV